jgi:hypothetical protein
MIIDDAIQIQTVPAVNHCKQSRPVGGHDRAKIYLPSLPRSCAGSYLFRAPYHTTPPQYHTKLCRSDSSKTLVTGSQGSFYPCGRTTWEICTLQSVSPRESSVVCQTKSLYPKFDIDRNRQMRGGLGKRRYQLVTCKLSFCGWMSTCFFSKGLDLLADITSNRIEQIRYVAVYCTAKYSILSRIETFSVAVVACPSEPPKRKYQRPIKLLTPLP